MSNLTSNTKTNFQPFKLCAIALAIASSTAFADTPYEMTQAELEATEAQLIAEQPEIMGDVRDSIRTLDNDTVEAITANANSNPANVKRVEDIIDSDMWDDLFSERATEYTYDNFLKAVGKFPAFCGDYDDGRDAEAICRKSLATMFAHFAQETGGHDANSDLPEWKQGLVYVREMGLTEDSRGMYNSECNPAVWQGEAWPCGTFEDGSFKSYFGRGAKQLSYNYNYGPFSQAIYGDVNTLLDNPEKVADTWLNLASAVFFYLYPQPPKASMLHVIDGTWEPNASDIAAGREAGFGVTTLIINGGVECGGATEHQQSQNRIDYYKGLADYLGVPIPDDEVLGCANMEFFDEASSAALNIYWEQDWSWVAGNPQDGASFACKLVNYQTPYTAFLKGDYQRCVEDKFNVVVSQ
ncbi:chitodextrinase [Sinobacterium caligoides]|uniref:Chitodextrinase n=1 Tax=Sinobacterium caligoides TaxID=933926 RepID=A0A3N2E0X3_9GAMM|nr:chitinase [Sinobacterium caligoides]ROS05552.1 chitodextrinase [Sinobacterium caligoides]